jgi:antirestriction protein
MERDCREYEKQDAAATVATDRQRIYVASLSDYNAGYLHGVWIDLGELDDIDDLWAKVKAMLAKSVAAKKYGDVAEEWAIHDYEGFGGFRVSEYESFEKVLLVANLIANKGNAFSTWLENDESVLADGDYGEIEEKFDEQFCGEFDSEKAFAEHSVEELGWGKMTYEEMETAEIASYLDYDAIARDLFMDYWFSNGYVFRSH